MIVRNCIIILDEAHPLEMTLDELRNNFRGNRVFRRQAIPADVLASLEEVVGPAPQSDSNWVNVPVHNPTNRWTGSFNSDTTAPEHRRAPVYD